MTGNLEVRDEAVATKSNLTGYTRRRLDGGPRPLLQNRYNLCLSTFRLNDEHGPALERCAPFIEVVMTIVRSFDAAQFVAKASFGHLAAETERRQMRARGPAQIVKREMP